MRDVAPTAKEEISYGIPAWKGKRVLAVLSPTKKDITFAFSLGAEFEDRYGLLQGVGKVSKHVKIKDLDSVNREALKYYIRQALQLDNRRRRTTHPTSASTRCTSASTAASTSGDSPSPASKVLPSTP